VLRRAPAPTPAAGDVELVVAECWEGAAREAARPRFRPASVTGEARGLVEREDGVPEKPRVGRFGHVFGSTVHLAIGMVLRDRAMKIPEAVRRAAARVGLTAHVDEAVRDVGRAMAALFEHGLVPDKGAEVWVEYPVAGVGDDGRLVAGYVDLVAVTRERVHVVDFKTDAAPAGDVNVGYLDYVGQVRRYGGLLAEIADGREMRPGLLFTADGRLREIGAVPAADTLSADRRSQMPSHFTAPLS
jgi:ATP-dependent helicase/nuclease subunit A